MAEQAGDKSQEPTQHRRQQARNEGQVAKSPDLASAATLIAGVLLLLTQGSAVAQFLAGYMQHQLGGDAWLKMDPASLANEWNRTILGMARPLLPILGLLVAGSILIEVLQVGLLFLPEKAAPDISRLNPLQGLSRIFSIPGAVKLGFGIFKMLIVAGVAAWCLYDKRREVLLLAAMPAPQLSLALVQLLLWTALKVAGALLALAIFDYGYQYLRNERDLRMTPDEVREEMKNLQGDPQVIARRRSVQRQLVLHRMSNAVPKADVVITNPTELAIAIRYEPETMSAPVVVAKGAGLVAQRIRELAAKHGIPVVERKPLAQALYKQVDIDKPIPADLYAGVAEVLAYVYQLTGKAMRDPAERMAAR